MAQNAYIKMKFHVQGVLMVAESNFNMYFEFESTFDPKIQDGGH